MTPNLFVLGKTALSPHKWFQEKKHSSSRSRHDSTANEESRIEHWDYPDPGYYEHEEGRGWYIIAKDGATPGSIKVPRAKVLYSRVLKRWIYETEMQDRKLRGRFLDESISRDEVGFFRLDNGVAWVNSSDNKGNHIDGPYTLYCIDAETKKFRIMKKKDDPDRQQRNKHQHRHLSSATSSRRYSSSSSEDEDTPPKYRKDSTIPRPSRPSSSRAVSSRAVSQSASRSDSRNASRHASIEPVDTLPLSTTRVHSISG